MNESLYSRRSNLIIGFHGCDQTVVDKVLAGEENLLASTNDYDWLGNGIYFWENNETRALQWAQDLAKRKNSSVKNPAVIGAIIDLGYCFDLKFKLIRQMFSVAKQHKNFVKMQQVQAQAETHSTEERVN